ncbi:hypothetical protein GGI35DRAFT_249252 [Trichoderma velutinum]
MATVRASALTLSLFLVPPLLTWIPSLEACRRRRHASPNDTGDSATSKSRNPVSNITDTCFVEITLYLEQQQRLKTPGRKTRKESLCICPIQRSSAQGRKDQYGIVKEKEDKQ